MKYKKMCSMIVAITLILPVVFWNILAVNADGINNNLPEEILNEIVEQSKKESGLKNKELHIMSNENARIMSSETMFMLESIEKNENGDIVQTSILPYKVLENGEMINSFQYALEYGSDISPLAINNTQQNL